MFRRTDIPWTYGRPAARPTSSVPLSEETVCSACVAKAAQPSAHSYKQLTFAYECNVINSLMLQLLYAKTVSSRNLGNVKKVMPGTWGSRPMTSSAYAVRQPSWPHISLKIDLIVNKCTQNF